jgi:undecaprenyl-diphosphatase
VAVQLAAATLLSTAITQVLKRMIARPRPSARAGGARRAHQLLEPLVEFPDAFSFPSGHAAAAAAAAVVLTGQGLAAAIGGWTLAAAIGSSRVYLGAHYPLDVAAGATLGVLAGKLAMLVIARAN